MAMHCSGQVNQGSLVNPTLSALHQYNNINIINTTHRILGHFQDGFEPQPLILHFAWIHPQSSSSVSVTRS